MMVLNRLPITWLIEAFLIDIEARNGYPAMEEPMTIAALPHDNLPMTKFNPIMARHNISTKTNTVDAA